MPIRTRLDTRSALRTPCVVFNVTADATVSAYKSILHHVLTAAWIQVVALTSVTRNQRLESDDNIFKMLEQIRCRYSLVAS